MCSKCATVHRRKLTAELRAQNYTFVDGELVAVGTSRPSPSDEDREGGGGEAEESDRDDRVDPVQTAE